MPAVGEVPGQNAVLEVDPPCGACESTGAAAGGDRMLAASPDLGAGRQVELGLEMIGRGEGARGPPFRLPKKTSSPRSWYTPLGVILIVERSAFVYQQPVRLPVIASGGAGSLFGTFPPEPSDTPVSRPVDGRASGNNPDCSGVNHSMETEPRPTESTSSYGNRLRPRRIEVSIAKSRNGRAWRTGAGFYPASTEAVAVVASPYEKSWEKWVRRPHRRPGPITKSRRSLPIRCRRPGR
jgi:hypothetical protein